MTMRNRKSLFLNSTRLRRGLHGGILKDGEGHEVEVGAGFAAAAAQINAGQGEDTTPAGDGEDTTPAGEGEDTAPAGGEGDDVGETDGDGEGEEPRSKRGTAEYIRELKRKDRERERENRDLRERLERIEKGGLPANPGGDNQAPTRVKPDPNDAAKYPLGVLDDGYIHDAIEYAADEKVAKALDGRFQAEREQAALREAEAAATALRNKRDEMATKGAEVFDDYDEIVVDGGLRGDWDLTQTTFEAAAEEEFGYEVLYKLAKDKTEAARVAKLSGPAQVKYIAAESAKIAETKTGRRKPKAGTPPSNLPAGRNASNPIRADTDSLSDFKKLLYAKK